MLDGVSNHSRPAFAWALGRKISDVRQAHAGHPIETDVSACPSAVTCTVSPVRRVRGLPMRAMTSLTALDSRVRRGTRGTQGLDHPRW